jgi:5-methylcytosine-specific restriction protein A
VKNGDWEGTLEEKIDRDRRAGIGHLLLVQRAGREIVSAALVPLDVLLPIWCAQRDISAAIIKQGKLGRRTKNHAMNGSSPTIWLRDDRAPEVAAALWGHKGVHDLAKVDVITTLPAGAVDDTYDDLPGFDYSLIGTDGAKRIATVRSHVKRDARVRAVVLLRAKGICERKGCGARRDYPSFLDVHHILGAEKSDRVWNCVALCPNCHREAHVAPNRDKINRGLLSYAMHFRVQA